MSDLLPCPFCGCNADIIDADDGFQAYCRDCRAMPQAANTYELAVKAWNTRVPDIETVSRILLEGKVNDMTIAMFKPKYDRLLEFVKMISHASANFYSTDAEWLLKEIGECDE